MGDFEVETAGGSPFLRYRLSDGERPDPVVWGMMDNNEIEGVLSARILQRDEEVTVRIGIQGLISLEESLQRPVGSARLLTWMESLTRIPLLLREYMIGEENLVWDRHYVYLDGKGALRMVCLPVSGRPEGGLREFCRELAAWPDVSCPKRLRDYLEDAAFSEEGFRKKVDETRREIRRPMPQKYSVPARTSGEMVLGERERRGSSLVLSAVDRCPEDGPDGSGERIEKRGRRDVR